jgi:hypothetical protein
MAQSSYTGRASDAVSDIKDEAGEQLGKAADQAERMAGSVADQGRQAGEQLQEVATSRAPSTSRSRISR